MNQLAILQQHQALCDEIHAAVLAENRFLRQHQHAPEASQVEHKRALLAKLDESLTALRTLPAASARDPEVKVQLEKTRARILQILQLDQENEQLLLRCSLSGGKRVSGDAKPAAGSVSMLQKIYARCS